MGFRQHFAVGLAIRLVLVVLAMAALAGAVAFRPPGAIWLVTAALLVAAIAGLWLHVDRTNRDIARFVEAVQFGDLTASFGAPQGGGYDELATALNGAIRKLRAERETLSGSAGFHEAMVDHVPIAILTVDAERRVTLANRSARRLFADQRGTRPSDFAQFGGALLASLTGSSPPERQVAQLVLPGGNQRAILQATEIRRPDGITRLVAVQPIHDALNAVELAVQSDLVRVLTHEIMNSITPVTSLAQSAADLMAEIDPKDDPAITDARLAVEAVARRANGVMEFVESYRQISRPPTIKRRPIVAADLTAQLALMFRADWPPERAELAIRVEPPDLTVYGDQALLMQVLINLMRNGAEAAADGHGPIQIDLSVGQARNGGVVIDVADNGPGIPEALRHEVFLPFFTTKASGTGVGLSFARQVIQAHDGTIEIEPSEAGGARFRIRL